LLHGRLRTGDVENRQMGAISNECAAAVAVGLRRRVGERLLAWDRITRAGGPPSSGTPPQRAEPAA